VASAQSDQIAGARDKMHPLVVAQHSPAFFSFADLAPALLTFDSFGLAI
jgi:hypothetical protein